MRAGKLDIMLLQEQKYHISGTHNINIFAEETQLGQTLQIEVSCDRKGFGPARMTLPSEKPGGLSVGTRTDPTELYNRNKGQYSNNSLPFTYYRSSLTRKAIHLIVTWTRVSVSDA